ncbi:MAG: T9SS type A sorting domain-containing protein, partial [Bacteroidota bacterium]
ADWNTLITNVQTVLFSVDIGSSPTEEYGLDNFCFESCPQLDCGGENLTIADPNSEDPCCPQLDYNNSIGLNVFGIEVRTLDGIEIDLNSVQLAPDYMTPNFTDTSRLITSTTFGILPTSIDDLARFCFSNVTSFPQYVVVDYLAGNFHTVLCSDTLVFECPVSNPCLDLVEESLECVEDGYALRLELTNPPGGSFEDIGYIQVKITDPAGLEQQLDFFYNPTIGANQNVVIDTIISTTQDFYGDSLCIVISAHDDIEQRLCCFVDSLCIPFPLCDPCPFVDAYLDRNMEDTCCYTLLIDNLVPIDPYFDSLTIELINGPNPTLASSTIQGGGLWSGTELITGALYGFSSNGTNSPFAGTPMLDFCVTPDFSPDSTFLKVTWFNTAEEITCMDTVAAICQASDPCPQIESYLVQVDSCCYDLYVSNNYVADPSAFQTITIDLFDGPFPTFGSVDILPPPSGWNFPITNVLNQSYTFTHPSGNIPLGANVKLGTFCPEEAYSTDSTFVAVSWTSRADTICNDTLSMICPECLTIDEDEIICQGGNDYTYLFNFTNYSPYPVNTVAIINTDPVTPGLVQEELIPLGIIVPVGGTYTGFLPVQLTGNAGDEVCFDIILRQVLPEDDIDIFCCFATHCVILPECEPNDGTCRRDDLIVEMTTCPVDELNVVCGCNGIEYGNPCLAIQAGVIDYTYGICENGNRNGIDLSGSLSSVGRTQLDWQVTAASGAVRFYEVQSRANAMNTWTSPQRLPATGTRLGQQYRSVDFLLERREYRVVGLLENGELIRSNIISLSPDLNEMGVQMALFPNPVTDVIHVTSNQTGPAVLSLISASGTVKTQVNTTLTGQPVRLNVRNQAPGVYTIQLRYADGSTSFQRFVKQ